MACFLPYDPPVTDPVKWDKVIKDYHLDPSKFKLPEITENRAEFTTLALDTYANVVSDYIRGIERKFFQKCKPMDYDDIFPLHKHWDRPNKWGHMLPHTDAQKPYDDEQKKQPLDLPKLSESEARKACDAISDLIPVVFHAPEVEKPALKKSRSFDSVASERAY